MSEKEYNIIDVIEDISKVGYSIGVFACKYIYKASSVETLKNSMDAYVASRFLQRLEYFINEHDKISNYEKEDFYSSLISNKQNMNYLYEFIEKARTTTYDIHSKIYALLSVRLIRNKGLKYYEDLILSNLHLLNEHDLRYLGYILGITTEHNYYTDNFSEIKSEEKLNKMKVYKSRKFGKLKIDNEHIFIIENHEHYMTYRKCLQFGIFDEIIEKDNSGYVESNSPKIYGVLEDRKICITKCTKIFAEILEDVL
ncbi:hypothetical protein [Arcobacter roscoffensis]|uniref:Uncharacterized protein n=1 Tax=Arcobacter roscoffensis TaxID=2961520 RepID=A0ABY5E6A1_9BACT|nr:hypothetical protein [Arcobacter roscoffensis]UTJ07387.1 hypothetical protein NJU99_04655 [Arcobacter roscoffensis]